jgi:hypothetical protein
VKRYLTVCLTLVALQAVACDRDSNEHEPSAGLDLAQAEEQMDHDVIASLVGTWTIRFHATICDRDQRASCQDGDQFDFTWYKDERERQRFDLRGASLGGMPFFPELSDDAQILFPVNDRTFTTLCASSFGPALSEAGLPAGDGACCEGYSFACGDAGDIGANIVFGLLGYVLEYAEGDLAGSTALKENELKRYYERDIAGLTARCYVIGRPEGNDETGGLTAELCFSADGMELYRDAFTPFARVVIEATAADGSVEDSDFDPPYPVIPNE